jgi:hypothetical protein
MVEEVDKVLLFRRNPQKTDNTSIGFKFSGGLFSGRERGNFGFRLAGDSVKQLFFSTTNFDIHDRPLPERPKKKAGLLRPLNDLITIL